MAVRLPHAISSVNVSAADDFVSGRGRRGRGQRRWVRTRSLLIFRPSFASPTLISQLYLVSAVPAPTILTTITTPLLSGIDLLSQITFRPCRFSSHPLQCLHDSVAPFALVSTILGRRKSGTFHSVVTLCTPCFNYATSLGLALLSTLYVLKLTTLEPRPDST